MRSRPDLKLYLTPGIALPGGRIRAEAELVSRSKTPIDGVEFHLVGTERQHTGTTTTGHTTSPIYREMKHVDLIARTPATTLDKGSRRLAVDFDFPAACPPSYKSGVTEIRYDLTVRVAIPWWPDRSERYVVNVVSQPSRRAGEPGSYCNDGAGPQGKALYLEASLDTAVIDHAGAVRGAVSFANVSRHRVRRIDVALVVTERPLDRSGRKYEAVRYVVTLHDGPPIEGEALPFHIKIPEKSSPSFTGSVVEVGWHVEIRAVIALGSDVTLQIPIEVVRRAPDAPADSARLRRVPPIGRDRRALVWAEAARLRGLVNDVNDERMTLDLGDGAALAITLEQRKEGGLFYTAAVTWPRLGLDFGVTERRWMDAWTTGEITLETQGFHDRFTVRGREPAQVLAFLDEASARAILLFDEAAIGDEGATLVAAGTAQSVDDLDAFVTRAVVAAKTLAQGAGRIPPPASMATFVPAWRAFAGALGGRLALGNMAIHDAAFDQTPIQITTKWPEKSEAPLTLLRVPITLRDAPETALATLDPGSRALVEDLKTQAQELRITAEAITATLPAPLADPASIEPLLIGLSRLARALSGLSERGPYR
ncbi:MAG: hypothetical protein ABJE95_10725 [Byssovorax sp.]